MFGLRIWDPCFLPFLVFASACSRNFALLQLWLSFQKDFEVPFDLPFLFLNRTLVYLELRLVL